MLDDRQQQHSQRFQVWNFYFVLVKLLKKKELKRVNHVYMCESIDGSTIHNSNESKTNCNYRALEWRLVFSGHWKQKPSWNLRKLFAPPAPQQFEKSRVINGAMRAASDAIDHFKDVISEIELMKATNANSMRSSWRLIDGKCFLRSLRRGRTINHASP